jgi:hypothetical protein
MSLYHLLSFLFPRWHPVIEGFNLPISGILQFLDQFLSWRISVISCLPCSVKAPSFFMHLVELLCASRRRSKTLTWRHVGPVPLFVSCSSVMCCGVSPVYIFTLGRRLIPVLIVIYQSSAMCCPGISINSVSSHIQLPCVYVSLCIIWRASSAPPIARVSYPKGIM